MMQVCSSRKIVMMVVMLSLLPATAGAKKADRERDRNELPRVFCLNPIRLAESKARLARDDASLLPAMKKLRSEADEALREGPFSVMDKKLNNHGTWYDAQVVSLALFTGQDELARTTLEQVKSRRISKQIEPDGRQPHELARTKSLGYSTMNLDGFFRLAAMGEKAGVDLWRYESDDGRSIRKALDFLAEYVNPDKKWPYEQIAPSTPGSLFSLLRRASIAYETDSTVRRPSREYEALIEKIPPQEIAAERTGLLWPYD